MYINNCSYYCHQASGVGLNNSLGTSTATVELEDLDYHFGDIEIDGSQPHHIQIYSLLHEAGHADDYVQHVMSGIGTLSETMDKEIAAWDLGEKIAKRLNFILDMNDWASYKDLCIKLYMEEE